MYNLWKICHNTDTLVGYREVMTLPEEKPTQLVEMGLRILKRRKQLKLSQEEVAEIAGISQQHVASAEKGKSGLSDASIIGLAKALQVSTEYILLGKVSDTDCEKLVELMEPFDSAELMFWQNAIRDYRTMRGYDDH